MKKKLIIDIPEQAYKLLNSDEQIDWLDAETILEVVAYGTSYEERPAGHWIKEKDCCLLIYRCSNCKKFIWSRETESDEKFEDLSRLDSYRYCPRCGADMRGDKNE